MKINLTKAQYKDLIHMSNLAGSIMGLLSDSLPDQEYTRKSQKMAALEEYLLQFANDFDCGELTEEEGGKIVLHQDFFGKFTLPIIEDFSEGEILQTLSNKLAWRDFKREHSAEEMEEMSKGNSNYFGVEIAPYEKKYWDEFEENGYERLEIAGTDLKLNKIKTNAKKGDKGIS